MPNEVYNLGRVGGLSAWEIYVRQSLLLNPDIEPLSEREWLSQSIGYGSSMLLRIPKETKDLGIHCLEFPFPANSLLSAPNTIIGSFFYGEGTPDEIGWCKKVTDYGPEIPNNSQTSPSEGEHTAHSLPKIESTVPDVVKRRMMQYIKIQDAVILQDGIWSKAETNSPDKTFIPDITKPCTLRITIQGQVAEDFFILLSGFSIRAIVKGETGFDMGSVIPDDQGEAEAFRPENGDFLGPTLYPWANKVVFTYPTILTYLLRDGFTSESKNLKITADPDSTKTFVDISRIKAGLGVQVDDASTLEDPAKVITVSSRIQSNNNYVEVVNQDAYNTEDGKSLIPTTLSGSPAKPNYGVGITQPAKPGDPHIIGAKIAIDTGDGANYLGISQSAPDDADQPATILIPAYGVPGEGIAIAKPRTPGGGFTISSKIKSDGDGKKYVKVEQVASTNPDAVTTVITPSKAVSGRGVGITQPTTPGAKHIISALIETQGCGEKYIGITQNANENRTSTDISTVLNPSKLSSRKGIAITQPQTPGGDVVISSIVETKGRAANYIKVEQEAHDSGCGCGCGDGHTADDTSTRLTPSQLIEASDKSRLVIDQPSAPGDDIRITTKIGFTPHKGISILDDPVNGMTHIGSVIAISGEGALGLNISQSSVLDNVDNASTTLFPSKHVVDERNTAGHPEADDKDVLTITYPGAPGGQIVYYLDVDEILRRAMKRGPLRNFMEDILDKIFGGGEIQDDGHIKWPDESKDIKIPLCDLNIYSNDGEGEVYTDALRGRSGNTSNDLRMK